MNYAFFLNDGIIGRMNVKRGNGVPTSAKSGETASRFRKGKAKDF